MNTIDLSNSSVRGLNQALHEQSGGCTEREWQVLKPAGQHNIACGLDEQLAVEIHGHAGYFCAGMNKSATVTVHGNVAF